ncbi:DUF6210 family protein (plasmid) [Deinococcus sp. KNUC1210]|uniref:DUF6210 family protein n=1 Tax=Deinococcus sp. KNUC1210 TaxID=2917691 RepID=UPI001EF0946F|nr:DUF6210 family protein [Deinococcus sp. KNUC1210]ULH18261.1 DUF6210 family protein [Deinococcus sp. KNUC1210]
MSEFAYVFLDPDGTQGAGVVVVVQAPTGVVYASQVGGHENDERSIEGFGIPLFHPQPLERLTLFFGRYLGKPPSRRNASDGRSERDLLELADIVGGIPLWRTSRERDEPAFLKFDRDRLEELTEGWVPVVTPMAQES